MKPFLLLTLAASFYLAASAVGHAETTNIRELTVLSPQISELSTAQAQQLSALTHAAQAQKAAIILQKIMPLSNAITDILGGAGPVDSTDLTQLTAQLAPIYADLAFKNLAYLLQVRALLTPEQLSAIAVRFQPTTPGHANDDPTSPAGSYGIFGDDLGLTREAKLTDAQSTQLATLEATAKTKLASIWQESDANYVQLDSLLNSTGAVTFEQLEPLQQRISALRVQSDAVGLDLAVKALALLTPAQRAQATTLRTQIAALHAQERALRN